ncbi:MAG: hypothetical protein IKJ68_11625 [Clostridia bacterium]|nr:hypothetical protein [Clostridia bacterium]
MKGEKIPPHINADKITHHQDKQNCQQFKEQKIIGDIDELIFPDDEPYYISER